MQTRVNPVKEAALKSLLRYLHHAVHGRRSGTIELHNSTGRIWHIHLYLGRILWVVDRSARMRRWQRFLRLYPLLMSPSVNQIAEQRTTDSWEYLTIVELVKLGVMVREMAIDIIQTYNTECLFDILLKVEEIRAISWLENPSDIQHPISAFDGISCLIKAQQEIKIWNSQGLSHYSPNDIPHIVDLVALQAQMTPNTYQSMSLLLTQNLSLRELAAVIKQPVVLLAQNLLLYVDQQAIELRTIDVPAPLTQAVSSPIAPSPTLSPSIVYIDENRTTCQQLGQVITAAGYRYTSIQDPMHAVPLLIEAQPNLIVLDPVISITSGYDLCGQIRRIPSFKETPIIILSASDGIVDRVRARVVGATGFLTKPIVPEKLLVTIERYLAPQKC